MPASEPQTASSRRLPLIALLAAFAVASVLVARNLQLQPAGLDFRCFWTGGAVALADPARLYDFAHVTALQHLGLSPEVQRPYVNPPSALLLFAPLAWLPFWAAYGVLMLLGAGLMGLAAARARAPWWLFLLPSVAFAVYCGQLSLLLGGLVLLGLTCAHRPRLAGLLFALAAVLKPQLLVLLPLALAAEGRWRTILATGITGLAVCALSALVFGLQPWFDWLDALPRFQRLVFADPELLRTSISPFARLSAEGVDGAWAWLLAPFAAGAVWIAFRREALWHDRLLALLGGGLVISPYAMNYELALLAPAVAAYLARTEDRRWLLYAVAAAAYAADAGVLSLAAVLLLPLIRTLGPAPSPATARA